MSIAAILFFAIGLPIAAFCLIVFANHLLMDRIPKCDPELVKTRTDIYGMRAAYAAFLVGLAILAVWAIGVATLGLIVGIRVLGR